MPATATTGDDRGTRGAVPYGSTIRGTAGVLITVNAFGTPHFAASARASLTLTPGTSYQVADDAEPHRSSTAIGARLFIVD